MHLFVFKDHRSEGITYCKTLLTVTEEDPSYFSCDEFQQNNGNRLEASETLTS